MSNDTEKDIIYKDISSSSKRNKLRQAELAVKNYEDGAFRHIDKVIKAISFIVSIGIFLVFTAVAAVVVMLDKTFAMIALGVFIFGIIFALISLFLIFAIGHIISLNKEILRRLKF